MGSKAFDNVYKLRTIVSVQEPRFGAKGDDSTDDTTAVQLAIDTVANLGGGIVWFPGPAKTYKVNNVRAKNHVRLLGDGYQTSYLRQGAANAPAYYALSDVSTGQLIDCGLERIGVKGHASATVAAVQVEATTPYVVHESTFDFRAESTYAALTCTSTSANEIYGNRFRVESDITTARSVTVTNGVYNEFDLFLTGCGAGLAVEMGGLNNRVRCVSDGSQVYLGQNLTIDNPTVETIAASASSAYAAIELRGFNCTAINPTVNNVVAAKVSSLVAIALYNNHTIINPRILGANAPTYPFEISAGSKSTFVAGLVQGITFKIRQYVSEALINEQTFVGDCSSYLGGTATFIPKFRHSTVPIGSVAYGSFGTNTTPVAGTIYLAEVYIDKPKTLTGIGVLNGSAAGTDAYMVGLFDADGALVANSTGAGTTLSGTNAFQQVPFTGAYLAVPGRYFIGVQLNGTTDRFRTIAASTFVDVRTKSTTGVFGTLPTQTVPTTFTADVGPIAYVY